ncbi:MAG: G-D-S-L family lipolytic protein [Flavobacteriales bacterium]|nr:MAG: G-D-S-L family lipolytic protein [Flavobacteriales bacterium]
MRNWFVLILLACVCVKAQDPLRFKEEVSSISKKYDTLCDPSKETVVFTGSSSVRIWNDLQERFPGIQIVNSGFGGSEASDLLTYTDDLILRYKPNKVFIYEGDNDLNANKRPRLVITDIKRIISRIQAYDPTTKIVLIAAKPSIARWHLKRRFKRLNRKMEGLVKNNSYLEYADVWKPMLQGRKVKQDIFVKDGLHMNAKGYDIWYTVLEPYLEE